MFQTAIQIFVIAKMHRVGSRFVTLGENQKIFLCLFCPSDVLPRMAEQGFTSHGRLVEAVHVTVIYLTQA